MVLNRKNVLLILFVAVLLEAIWLLIASRTIFIQTDYAPLFEKAAFMKLKPGDDIRKVFRDVGPPLSYRVVSEGTNELGRVLENSTNAWGLFAWRTNSSVLLYLQYSKPRRYDEDYKAWEILMRTGVVQEARTYIYWD